MFDHTWREWGRTPSRRGRDGRKTSPPRPRRPQLEGLRERGVPSATPSEVVLLMDMANPAAITQVGDVTFFVAASHGELWKTDGTPTGTVQVRNINSGMGSFSPANLTAVGGKLYFTA